jgi:hypothetical protein
MRIKNNGKYIASQAQDILAQAGFKFSSELGYHVVDDGFVRFQVFKKEDETIMIQIFENYDIDVFGSAFITDNADDGMKQLRLLTGLDTNDNAGVIGSLTGSDVKYGTPTEFINYPLIEKVLYLREQEIQARVIG